MCSEIAGKKEKIRWEERQAYNSVTVYASPAKKKPDLKIKLVWQAVRPMRLALFGFNCVSPVLSPGLGCGRRLTVQLGLVGPS